MPNSSMDFSSYVSPYSWRYGSDELRKIFSEKHKYELWRKIWLAVASAEQRAGLLTREELEDLKKYQYDIDINRILEIEKKTKHDVVAAIREFAEKAKLGRGKIHLGLTSMDIVDNAAALQTKEALSFLLLKLHKVLTLLKGKIKDFADLPCLGYTHLQPAEPTTVGYRFAFYAQDILMDYENLQEILTQPLGKGIKGAVGTQASFVSLLGSCHSRQEPGADFGYHKGTTFSEGSQVEDIRQCASMTSMKLEQEIMSSLELKAVDISNQVYTRKIDYKVVSLLAGIAASIAKFAADLRILQSPQIGEWSEPFGESQVGSSAMPYKKNPINSEKICSLARMIAGYPQIMLENISHSYLDRTLDDSANKRIVIPEIFLTVDEILDTAEKILSGMTINTTRIAFNLAQYAPFLASEAVLIESVKKGADRQVMHEVLRELAMVAWEAVAKGKKNPMKNLMIANVEIIKYLTKEEIEKLLDVSGHIGTAPERAKKFAEKIAEIIEYI